MRLFAALLLLAALPAIAGEAQLSWTPPTQNTDGSALTDLAGYRIVYGQSAPTLSEAIELDNAALTAYMVEGLAPGTWFFGVMAVNAAGAESDLSSIASKTIAEAPPNPPDDLTVEETTVYQVIGTRNAFALIPVGTVPADTACNSDQSVNGHYGVPREAVTWFGNVQPQSVVAKCF